MDYFDEINSLEYLFLVKIKDLPANKLSITIKAATISEQEEDLIIGEKNIGPVRSISQDGPGLEYELFFDSYGSYCVINESFTAFNKNEERVGRLLCIYSKSTFMDYIRETTLVEYTYDYDKTLTHYAVNCQDHVIYIISKHEPIIKRIN
jgi:hypothetical protein